MDILRSLGVNWTLFVHFLCFGVSYIFLTKLVLKPYLAAHHEREKRTVGNEEMATRVIEEANKLQAKFEQRAKAINHEMKAVYDQSRTEAMERYDALVNAARSEANQSITGTRTQIETEVQRARRALSAEIPAVSAAIASKLAGKELA